MGCGKVRHRSPRHGTWENEGTGKPKRRRARFAPYTGLRGARVPQARLRGHYPRRVPAPGRNVRPARRIRCVFVHARPKPRINPFSHSHAPGLESAYTKPKRKSGQAALFLHMSTECSMCTGRQNTRHRKPYPFALCICIGISIYIYINICIRFFILCRKETIGFISPYA